jgi:hypothetical protein
MFYIIIYNFFPRGTSYGRGRRRNFKRVSFDLKSRVLVPFLIVENDWRATSPPPPRLSFPQTKFLWKRWSYKLRRGLIALKIGSLSAIFKSKLLEGSYTPPPHVAFFPNVSDRNFEIAIRSKIVKKSHNTLFRVDTTPRV